MTNLLPIVVELNERAKAHDIGKLGDIRRRLPGRRQGSSELFPLKNVNDDAAPKHQRAFHHGGRKELQFNVGFESVGDELFFRHGVAFSMETSRFVHEEQLRELLVPKILRFNDYVRQRGQELEDMRLWCWSKRGGPTRLPEIPVTPIPEDWRDVGHFIFFGKLQALDDIDYESVLGDLDRLLPLYEFVEGKPTIGTTLVTESPEFQWRSGHTGGKRKRTSAAWTKGTVEVSLRHNELQDRLYEHLCEVHGKKNVGTELTAGNRKRIDAAVRRPEGLTLYEIKTSSCVESCIREALAQLIEYSYWVQKADEEVSELVVVSENRPTPVSTAYVKYLQDELGLPVTYKRISRTGGLQDD